MRNKNYLFLATTAVLRSAFFLKVPKVTADEFYKGKTIRFIVGYAPGGGYDTYTRAIARHIGTDIPWTPWQWSKHGGSRAAFSGQLHVH